MIIFFALVQSGLWLVEMIYIVSAIPPKNGKMIFKSNYFPRQFHYFTDALAIARQARDAKYTQIRIINNKGKEYSFDTHFLG
jgi:hypothetical protein